ncbi:DNA-directed RNA polymerase subunit K [Candidatus Bathyarchaeota archaeon]|nr:DNA-directed RNA polymerase subunit K [Candidatus Bathyarchaeota archaeon]
MAKKEVDSKRATKAPETQVIGPPRLTRFERARIVGARALQIAMGAPVFVKLPKELTNPIDIACYELSLGILPITVRRRLPDGSYQDIPIQWLLKNKTSASE